MKLVHQITLLLFIVSIAGCLPDSFTKWESEEEKNVLASPATVSIDVDGEQIRVADSSGGTPPSSMTLTFKTELASTTLSSLKELRENKAPMAIGKEHSLTPSFPEGTSGTFYYSITQLIDGVEVRFPYYDYGLSFDKDTGVLSGTPTKYLPSSDIYFKSYHVESGIWTAISMNILAVTSFGNEESNDGQKVYYPYFKDYKNYFIIEVEDTSSFMACPYDATKPPCVTSDNGVQGYVEYINEEAKKLFVTVANYEAEDHAIFEDATTLDNSNNFVFNDSAIVSVVRLFKRCTGLETTSCDREVLPNFNFELASEDEKATLEWSITPIPAGGIAATRGELSPGIGFIEESLGTNSGSIFIPGNSPSLMATPFNVSVKNLLGETLSTTVTISVSQAPENLSVGNLYILTLDSNEDFRVGNFISANNSTNARGKVLDKVGMDKLIIELQNGDFEKGDQVDHLQVFSRKRGVIHNKTLFNSVLTVESESDISLPNEDAPEENEYKNKISQTLETTTNTAVIKGINQNLYSLHVNGGAHQFSPGLQIVQAGDDSACDNGEGVPTTGAVGTIVSLMRNEYNGDKDFDEILIVNVLSGTFKKNKPIQLGGSEYDCTTTSVDMVAQAEPIQSNFRQIYAMVPNGFNFSMVNPNEVKDSSDHLLKINEATTGTLPLFSVWSQNIQFHSINEAGTWNKGDYISTRSHIPGVINHVEDFTEPGLSDIGAGNPGMNEDGQIVTAHFNQVGFLFSSIDSCNDGGDGIDFTEREACRNNSPSTKRNPGRGDEGDGDPEIIFAKGSTYKFENIINMSASNVSTIGFEDDGDTDADATGISEDLRDDPQIKNLTTTHHYVFYVREPLVLKSELQYGDGTFFEISPKELPLGLEFDSTNGTLSGIPTQKLNRTSFTITAKNPIGEASADFTIEIKDHFRVAIPKKFTEPESFKLHMSGQGNQATDCRITADQIEGNNQEVKDILCHLEAGEMDLYFLGLQLQYNIGPSMCEFVSFDPYTTYNTDYPYIKTGTVGEKNGASYDLPRTTSSVTTFNGIFDEELKNVDNGVKISRVYQYDDSCVKCMDPETGDILDCNDANFPKKPAGGNHCASDYRRTPFDKNCDDGKFKIRQVIIGADDQEIPTSDGDIAKLKDGICGYKSGVLAPNDGSNSTQLTYQSFKFYRAVIDKNSDGKANASDDFDGTGVQEVTGNGTEWTGLNFNVPCSDGEENSITYTASTLTNELEIEFELTDAGDAGGACSAEDVEGNSVGNRVTYPLIRVVGSFDDTTLRALSDKMNDGSDFNNNSGEYNYWFVDSNTDDIPDSIVFDLDGDNSLPNWAPNWTTLKTCGQCKDINGDGEIDFVDFNSDGIADDIGLAAADGIGDHTFGSRIDATESAFKDEPVELCNGNPRLCLDGSSELITSHDFDNESAIRGFELNSVYGVEAETFTFDAPANRFEDNSKLANYSAENSCGLNPRIIHQNSIFHDADGDGNYSNDTNDVLTSTFLQSNAGAALLFAKTGAADTFTTTTDESLFFELFASYDDENFYKGLGDLIYDDFKVLVDDDAQNGGGANNGTGEEDDFSPSVTLPFVYKQTFDNKALAEGDMGVSPMLGLANDGVKYQLVSIQSAYDPDVKKSEITYFDNGFKNLANLARKEIIRLPVTFDHNNNLRGILVKGPANDEEGIVINQDNVKNTVDILLTKGSKNNISNGDQWVSSNGVDSLSTVNVFAIDSGSKGLMPIPFANYNFGSSVYKTKPYYTFNCLDAARDLKARIRVEVRDWDRVFTAGHDIDKAIPSSLMDDSSIDLWDEDFNNRADGDGYGSRTLKSCLINYPTGHKNEAYNSLPANP